MPKLFCAGVDIFKSKDCDLRDTAICRRSGPPRAPGADRPRRAPAGTRRFAREILSQRAEKNTVGLGCFFWPPAGGVIVGQGPD